MLQNFKFEFKLKIGSC